MEGTLNKIRPVMAIANQFSESNPAIAYFCEMWALQQTSEARVAYPEEQAAIMEPMMQIMDVAEKHKAIIEGTPQFDDGMGTVSTAAWQFFNEAQAADLAGQGGRDTCKNYMQAMILYETTKQFQEQMPPPMAADYQLCKERVTAIKRALKAGHQFAAALPPRPAGGPPQPQAVMAPGPPPGPGPAPATLAPAIPNGMPCWQPKNPQMHSRDDVLNEARRQALFVSNALSFQDVDTAINCTRQAIALLEAVN